VVLQMGKNGGEPRDTILTLEEALKRFARKRLENSETRGAAVQASQGSKVRYADFSASTKPEQEKLEETASASAHPPAPAVTRATAALDARKDDSGSSADIVAMIDGVPRTLEDLELLAAADKAFREDFPDSSDEPEFPEPEETTEPATSPATMGWITSRRDLTFGAVAAAVLVWVAILVTRVPIVNQPITLAKAVPTPALKASSLMTAQDLISTWVIVPDSTNDELASVQSVVQPGELEAAIKDTLRTRAFSDIGVSVSHQGDAYLAGDVYSLAEARRIRQIAGGVSGVRRVHFLHPDVLPADGPGYFGVTTAWAPDVWGAKVQAVFIGSPADKAGVRAGDVISEFGGNTVPDAKAFDDLIAQYSPGQRVEFRVWHNGQPLYLVTRLTEMTTMASR
jgi:hypothetical protein